MKDQPADYRTNERSQEVRRWHLYHFNYAGTHYYYAAYDRDVIVSGGPVEKMNDPQTFVAAQIGHTRPEESLDANPGVVTVSLAANDLELKKYFISASPKLIDVEIWRVSTTAAVEDVDYDDDMRMIFRGIVDSVGFDDLTVQARCVTQMMREDMPIPRFFYQKMCNHFLYDDRPGSCNVNRALFTVSLTISALNRQSGYIEFNLLTSINIDSPSRSLTITAETFQGGVVLDLFGNEMGIMVCETLAGPKVRLWLLWMPLTLAAGQTVDISMGCIRIKRVCHDTFHNLPNFGGTPYVPVGNPAVDGLKI